MTSFLFGRIFVGVINKKLNSKKFMPAKKRKTPRRLATLKRRQSRSRRSTKRRRSHSSRRSATRERRSRSRSPKHRRRSRSRSRKYSRHSRSSKRGRRSRSSHRLGSRRKRYSPYELPPYLRRNLRSLKRGQGRGSPTRFWRALSPRHGRGRHMLHDKCGDKAFLLPKTEGFPVMSLVQGKCKYSPRGLQAAYNRARQYHHPQVAAKAKKLLNRYG